MTRIGIAISVAALFGYPPSALAGPGAPSEPPFPTGRATMRSGPAPAATASDPAAGASAPATGTPVTPPGAAIAPPPLIAPPPAPAIVPPPLIAPPPATAVVPPRILPERAPSVDPQRSDAPSGWPKLVIAGGVYSDNQSHRMVIINGQPVREGAEPMPGLVVEQVRASSVVLNYRGQRHTVAY